MICEECGRPLWDNTKSGNLMLCDACAERGQSFRYAFEHESSVRHGEDVSRILSDTPRGY